MAAAPRSFTASHALMDEGFVGTGEFLGGWSGDSDGE
jgi:hypothetical protein